MQGFNRYIPPGYDPKENSTLNSFQGKKHALGKRAKDIDKGILVVRFELPFNIWCGTCNAHLGAGVRYNAQKRKVGNYFSTPIWAFRCKCHLCSGWFEVQTDPKNAAYVVGEGATKKDEDWNPEENGGFAVHDTEAPSAALPPEDPFAGIEKTIDQQQWAKKNTSRLTELTRASTRISGDPYVVNSALRRRFREEKRVMLEKQGRDDDVRERYGLHGDVDLGEEDVELGREMWEAGRERRGLPIDDGGEGEGSSKEVGGTPMFSAKGKGRAGEVASPSLAQVLRKTTARKYDPFGEALEAFSTPGGGVKVKGRIKDPGVLEGLAVGVRAAKEKETVAVGGAAAGLLAGYRQERSHSRPPAIITGTLHSFLIDLALHFVSRAGIPYLSSKSECAPGKGKWDTMFPGLSRDPERSPLLPRPPMSRAASGIGPSQEEMNSCDVFGTVLMIRQDVMEHIDAPVSWQKLLEPEVSFAIVRPLSEKYIGSSNLSIVYCLLANRLQFLRDSTHLPHARLNTSRASLCELLATRLLNHYARLTEPAAMPSSLPHTPGRAAPSGTAELRRGSGAYRAAAVEGARQRRMSVAEPTSLRMARKRADELVLANVLFGPFRPFSGAPKEVREEEEEEGRRGGGRACNALELAIVSEAKSFISSVACQKVLGSVWTGRLYYTPTPFFDLVRDSTYKQKAITLYDARHAPFLDHYRLRVPRYRFILEFLNFAIVFGLTMIVLNTKRLEGMNGWEIAFVIYTAGWTLDRFATTLEHGWRVFAANLWNGIDASIIAMYLIYLPIRLYGLSRNDADANDWALSILACESALLFPRLAFFFLSGNVLVMSLRAMLAQFAILMFAAIWIFVGFWHALYVLDEGNYGVWEIAKYMVNIWFGLDATGFNISTNFHPHLGPALFFIFACLANTLFITVVVAILSTTFAELNSDAKAEFMFRLAVGTLEGVKSDALFSFQPPLNILALLILAPASWILSPRVFHKTHVFLTRLTNAPILALITIFERLRLFQRQSFPNITDSIQRALPDKLQELSLFVEGAHGDIEAVFDYAPDTKLLAKAAHEEEEYAHEHGRADGAGEGLGTHYEGNEEDEEERVWRTSEFDGLHDEESGVGKDPASNRGENQDDQRDGRSEQMLSASPIQSPKLHFEANIPPRRISVVPSEGAISPTGVGGGAQSPLRQLFDPSADRRSRSVDLADESPVLRFAAPRRASGAEPDWIKDMRDMLRGIEERQKRIEESLRSRWEEQVS